MSVAVASLAADASAGFRHRAITAAARGLRLRGRSGCLRTTTCALNIERSSLPRAGPLQALTGRELALREQPVTIYPHPYVAVRAWVRFGPEAIRVDAKLVRSTPLAAGVEVRASRSGGHHAEREA